MKMNADDALIQINEAIKAIESGAQEYKINNRQLKRANLKDLYDERAALQSRLAAEQNNGFGLNTYVARFDKR